MSFNQSGPTVPTVLNTSNCFVFGNTASGNALSVQQLGAGNCMSVSNANGTVGLFVSSLGRVGIGTANPQATFHSIVNPVTNGFDAILGQMIVKSYSLSLSTTVGAYSNICTIATQLGAFAVDLDIVCDQNNQTSAKSYRAAFAYGGAASGWTTLGAISTGYGQNPFEVDIYNAVSQISYTFRLRRINGTVTGPFLCTFRIYYGPNASGITITDTPSPATGTGATSIGVYAGTPIYTLNGNVGIGTTNPGYALDVQGPGSPVVTWTGYLWYNNSTGNPATAGTDYVAVNTNGAYRTTNGGFLKVSDVRIKKNIQPISNVFDAVLALKPCTFQYIDEAKLGSRIVQGFIAQEVEQVLPGVVNKTGTGYVPDIYTRGRVDGTTIILDSAPKNTQLEGLKIQVYYQNSSNVEASFEANVVSYSDKTITIDCESPSNEVFVYGTFTDRMYSVSNESMVPTLVAAIQELSTENTQLKARLDSLEARLAAAGL